MLAHVDGELCGVESHMRYNLAAMAGRRPRRRVILRPIEPTAALAQPLRFEAQAIITAIREAVATELLPGYAPRPVQTQDADSDFIGRAVNGIRELGTRLASTLSLRLSRWSTRVEEWHRFRFASNIKAGTGVEIVAFLTSADAQDQTAAALSWASSLITNVTDDLLNQIESAVWVAYANGTDRRELGKQLAGIMQISRKRADRIAIDQTTKLASNLDQMRQLEAGIMTYEWRHSGKLHPRLEHVARNGKVFRWDKPPADGHPGQAPFCGCRAMPSLELE